MALEKCGDADNSIEMQAALKRFEDVCHSLDDEHAKLLELEKRRQKLNDDLERLRNEIKEEKTYFRSMIDDQVAGKSEGDSGVCGSELTEPMGLNTGVIKQFIENRRNELASLENDGDLNHFQNNPEQAEVGDATEKPDFADVLVDDAIDNDASSYDNVM